MSASQKLRLRVTPARETSPVTNGHGSKLGQEEIDKIDPFTYYPPFTTLQKLLTFINILWLAPIRFLVFVAPSVIVGSISALLTLIGDNFDRKNPKPLGKWGQFLHNRVHPYIARWFLLGFGFNWITVRGKPAPSEEAPIYVVAPHTSMLDVFVLMIVGVPTFIARGESQHVPFFGLMIERSIRAIFVYREDPESRANSIIELQRRVKDKEVWPNVFICPEGTTTNKKVMLKFKPGAFVPKLPLQPVLIKYKNKLDTTSWGGDGIDWFGTLLFTGCQFHNPLEIEFLPTYYPSQAEKDNPRLYANNVQSLMSRSLQIPVGNQAVEDLLLMRHSRACGLPFSKGMVVYFTASHKTNLKLKEMKRYLTRFAKIDSNKDGYITIDDLATFLGVPQDVCLEGVFNNCKKDKEGKVLFADYLCGMVGSSLELLKNDQLTTDMFNYFDSDQDGRLSLNELTRSLSIATLPKDPPSTLNTEDFKDLLRENPEWLLLFSECQKAGVSFPNNTQWSPPGPISTQTNGHSNGHSNGHTVNGTHAGHTFV